MTTTQYGVRFPVWGDRPMPNEHIARHVAKVTGHPLIVRAYSVTGWAVTS